MFYRITLTMSISILLFSCERNIRISSQGVRVKYDSLYLDIKILSSQAVSVCWYHGSNEKHDNFLLNRIYSKGSIPFSTEKTDSLIQISTGSMVLTVNKYNGQIEFLNNSNQKKLNVPGVKPENFMPSENPKSYAHVIQYFKFNEHEKLHGLGQNQEGHFNLNGKEILLSESKNTLVLPMLSSSANYGIIWDNYSKSIFNAMHRPSYFWSEMGTCIHYIYVCGNNSDQLISEYRQLTGKANLLPKNAFGYNHKYFHEHSSGMINLAENFRKRRIPVDVISDNEASTYNGDLNQEIIQNHFQTFSRKELLRYLNHQYNIQLAIEKHVNDQATTFPFLNNEEVSKETYSNVYSHPQEKATTVSMSNDLDEFIYNGYYISASFNNLKFNDDRLFKDYRILSLSEDINNKLPAFHNLLSMYSCDALYHDHLKNNANHRAIIFCNSAFPGIQARSGVTIAHSEYDNWLNFQKLITQGINFSLSGSPWWGNTGLKIQSPEFFKNGIKNPAFRELYIRWFQFNAFCPIFLTSASDQFNFWQLEKQSASEYQSLIDVLTLRYRLFPYIYSTAGKVYHENFTMLRALVMDFNDDSRALEQDKQFMFGSEIMVCPVYTAIEHNPENISDYINPELLYSSDAMNRGFDISFTTMKNELVETYKCEILCFNRTVNVPDKLKNLPLKMHLCGKILAKQAGEYQFRIKSTAGVKIFMNDQLMINEADNGAEKIFTFTIHLNAGSYNNLDIHYVQHHAKNMLFDVTWIQPGQADLVFKNTNQKEIYLPSDHFWYNFWTGDTVHAGKTIHENVSLSHIPLFVPAGSIIPFGPDMQYIAEKPDDPLEIRIYPGKDASFELYEDDGITNSYKTGEYNVILFSWDDSAKKLNIKNSKNNISGLASRTFNIIMVKKGRGTGITGSNHADKTVNFIGKEINIDF